MTFDLTRGGISSLVETATGRELADRSSPHALGQFIHERFSTEEVFPRFFNKYSRIQDGWGFNDIGKPGMADAKTAPYTATTPGPWTIEIRRGEVADTATLTAADPRGPAKGYTVAFTFPRDAAYVDMWNTNFPLWQDGSWFSRVRFWPASGKTSAATDLAVRSWEARVPLFGTGPVPSGSDDGDLPATRAGLTVSRPGVLVTAFGTNPDGGPGTLLRVWDQTGESADLTVTIPGTATTATPVNLRGEKTGAAIPIKDGKLVFPLKAYAPASFVLESR